MNNKIDKKELHEIFQNLRSNNQSAYNKLYERYYNLIYGIVFSILKNKDDSEDIVHEIFTKIYKLDRSKLPTNNEASWLFTVSKNEAFLFFRKSKQNINLDDIYEISESSSDLDKIIDTEYYNKIISNLKEEEKQIVSLKILSNFTFQKISQLLDIPIGTVQWKYYKAINSLKISISSLAGSVIALVLIFVRREYWNRNVYMNKSESDDEILNKDIHNQQNAEQENASQENDNQEDYNQEKNDISMVDGDKFSTDNTTDNSSDNVDENSAGNIAENIEQNIEQNTLQSEQTEPLNLLSFKPHNDVIQYVFLGISIVLFITFLIFLKKYQQKLKRKSSK